MGKHSLLITLNDGLVTAPGQLRGMIHYSTTARIKCELIDVKVKGEEVASVSYSTGSGKTRSSHTATRKQDHMENTPKIQLLVAPKREPHVFIEPGEYSWPFQFDIPGMIPPTFDQGCARCRYTVKVTVHIPWGFDHTSKHVFVVLPLQLTPSNQLPEMREVKKSVLFGGSEMIRLRAIKENQLTCVFDPTKFFVFVNNPSNKKVKNVKFKLIQVIYVKIGGHSNTKMRIMGKYEGGDEINQKGGVLEKEYILPTDKLKVVYHSFVPSFSSSYTTVSYYWQVYLDVAFARDPTIKMDTIVVYPGEACTEPVWTGDTLEEEMSRMAVGDGEKVMGGMTDDEAAVKVQSVFRGNKTREELMRREEKGHSYYGYDRGGVYGNDQVYTNYPPYSSGTEERKVDSGNTYPPPDSGYPPPPDSGYPPPPDSGYPPPPY